MYDMWITDTARVNYQARGPPFRVFTVSISRSRCVSAQQLHRCFSDSVVSAKKREKKAPREDTVWEIHLAGRTETMKFNRDGRLVKT